MDMGDNNDKVGCTKHLSECFEADEDEIRERLEGIFNVGFEASSCVYQRVSFNARMHKLSESRSHRYDARGDDEAEVGGTNKG